MLDFHPLKLIFIDEICLFCDDANFLGKMGFLKPISRTNGPIKKFETDSESA